ncbi:Peptidase_S10 domain-containing protein, partial [Cephalotus follicularis]
DASLKPLVLWLQGGPGCSSIAIGAVREVGPFLIQSNGTQLTLNDFSWNKVANMLFLESPAGVGFSYTNDYYSIGDESTANDSLAFLLRWFERFPSFKSSDFYITGESYAGHYAPQLADVIYERNKAASKDSYINLKGIMVGNPILNELTDSVGAVDFAWSHGCISDKLRYNVKKECLFRQSNKSKNCPVYYRQFLDAYSMIDDLDIYAPICLVGINSTQHVHVAAHSLTKLDLWGRLPASYDPCTTYYVMAYFNREDVQRALHANTARLPHPYIPCSPLIQNWTDAPSTVLPTIQKLINVGLRFWVFSGDTDGRVPLTSTRYSINKMGLKVKEEWRAWFHERQVAGWVETYEGGLTLATVRGAGHNVPTFAPGQSLSLFAHFLTNQTLPSS